MIALQGMTPPEDVFLNLGGMFAIVVAIVPTGRGADFETPVQACRDSGGTLLTHQASKNLDCPGVLALRDGARANVENNMAALLAVGGLALVLAGVFLFKDWTAKRDAEGRKWVLAGFFRGGAGVAGRTDRPRGLRRLASQGQVRRQHSRYLGE